MGTIGTDRYVELKDLKELEPLRCTVVYAGHHICNEVATHVTKTGKPLCLEHARSFQIFLNMLRNGDLPDATTE